MRSGFLNNGKVTNHKYFKQLTSYNFQIYTEFSCVEKDSFFN